MAQMYIFTSVSDIILNVLAAACIRLCNVHCTPFSQIFTFFFQISFFLLLTILLCIHINIRIKKIGKERETKNFLKKIFSINFCLCSLCVASLYVYEPIWAKWKQHETYKYSIFYTFKKRRKKKLNKSWKNWCKRNKKRGKILNLLV